MKHLIFTATSLIIVWLSFWVTISRNEINTLKHEVELKRDTIQAIYENDLQALIIINENQKNESNIIRG